LIWICYKHIPQRNRAELGKKKTAYERKRLTAGNGFVIKFDFAGQLFATSYDRQEKGKRLKYLWVQVV
jgi:hypothetical protein